MQTPTQPSPSSTDPKVGTFGFWARKPCGAYTLIEMIVVLTIVVFMLGLIFKALLHGRNIAAHQQAKAEIAEMTRALEAYKSDYGVYPLSPTDSSNSPPLKWIGAPWPPGIGNGFVAFGLARANYYYPQQRWPSREYEAGSDYSFRVSACLWYFLYQAQINGGKLPYMTFSKSQVTPCYSCSNTTYKTIIDPWGRPYMYGLPSMSYVDLFNDAISPYNIITHNPQSFEIISAGPGTNYWDLATCGGGGTNTSAPCGIADDAIANFNH